MKGTAFAAALALAPLLAFAAQATAQVRTVPRGEVQRLSRNVATQRVVKVGAATIDTVSAEAPTVELQPGEFLAVRTDLAATNLDRSALFDAVATGAGGRPQALGGQAALDQPAPPPEPEPTAAGDATTPAVGGRGTVLPFDLLMPAVGGSVLALRPVYLPLQRLRYDEDQQAFVGKFFIALEDTLRPNASQELESAVRMQFTSDADALEPSRIEVAHTNFPLLEVDVRARRVQDSVRIRIIPEFDLAGVDVWLGADPALEFQGRGRRIQGLGVQTAELAIGVVGPSPAEPVTVFLDADRGTIEPSSVEIGPSGVATARIRSAGVGPTTVQASSPGLGTDQMSLEFVWPVLFLVAALLGGAVGGAARWVQTSAEARRETLAAVAGKGMLLGALAAAIYYAVGVSLIHVDLGVERFNEGAVFAFAALAGLFGLKILPGKSRALETD